MNRTLGCPALRTGTVGLWLTNSLSPHTQVPHAYTFVYAQIQVNITVPRLSKVYHVYINIIHKQTCKASKLRESQIEKWIRLLILYKNAQLHVAMNMKNITAAPKLKEIEQHTQHSKLTQPCLIATGSLSDLQGC